MERINIFIILLCILSVSVKSYGKDEFPVLEGPYFGQKPPGLTPVVFASGIVSVEGRYEYGVNFSPSLDEMFFCPTVDKHSVTYFSRIENGRWTEPKKANFTKGRVDDEFSAVVSGSGERIYFTTYSETYPLKVWYVNRFKNSWSEAVLLDSPINSGGAILTSEASNGDIYYIDDVQKKMFVAFNDGGEFSVVQEVNIDFGLHGYISPEQDYFLVGAHKENDAKKDKDIYVYFKRADGTWSKPISLGDSINTHHREGGPTVSPDGKYLFFNRYDETSGKPNIYWVDAKIIENLKPRF